MESLEQRPFKVDTIENGLGDSVSFSLERGGIIRSLKLSSTEILYMDPKTFNNPKVNVRGGIPILFPNSGPIQGLPQHGFARTSSSWQRIEESKRGYFKERLFASNESYAHEEYKYPFILEMEGLLDGPGKFRLTQSVRNAAPLSSTPVEMPVAMGLHPYFRVPKGMRDKISFDFPRGKILDQNRNKWMNDGTVSFDNPMTTMYVDIPEIGKLAIEASPLYRKIWVWSKESETDEDFICIEPVVGDEGTLTANPLLLKPGEVARGEMSIRLIK